MLFCVDASGSMAARRRMEAVKTAVLSLLTDAYQRRDKVGLVTFRGAAADLRCRRRRRSRWPPAGWRAARRRPYPAGRGPAVRGGNPAGGTDPGSAAAAAAGRRHRRSGHPGADALPARAAAADTGRPGSPRWSWTARPAGSAWAWPPGWPSELRRRRADRGEVGADRAHRCRAVDTIRERVA